MKRLWVASDLMLGISQKQRDKFRPKLKKKHDLDFFHMWESSVSKEDGVILLGNIAGTHPSDWFEKIQRMPGKKVLFISELEQNRPKWYFKYGFDNVVSFGQGVVIPSDYGNVLFSALPAKTSVQRDGFYYKQILNLEKLMDRYSCIMNIHGYSNGRGNETKNTFDVSLANMGVKFMELYQILDMRFK